MPSTAHAEWRLRAAAFLSSFDRFTIPPLLVPIHQDLGVSLGAAAIVASAYFVAYGLSQPLWGALSDRIGRVAVIRLALVGAVASCVAAGVAQALPVLIGTRALSGMFFAALVPTAITYIGDTVAVDRRQHALAILMAFSTSGVAVATMLGGLAAELATWRLAFLASALLAAVLVVVLRRLPEPRRARSEHGFGRQVVAVLGQRWVAVVVGIAFVEGAVVFGSLTFVAASLQHAGVGAALAGSAAAGFGLANVVSTPLVTRAIRRFPSPLLIAGGSVLAGAGLLFAALQSTVLGALVATVALGAGFGFLHSTMQMWATQVYPAGRAVTVAFFACALFTGGAAASAVAAPLAGAGHFAAIFFAASAGAAALAVFASALRARYVAWAGAGASGGPPVAL